MTMSGNRYEPLFDVHPVTGASIEVFFADGLATFGRGGAGWFWWPRQRGFAPNGPARGPFPTDYSAYRNAMLGDGLGANLGTVALTAANSFAKTNCYAAFVAERESAGIPSKLLK